ncbi:transposase family protein [Micromonospora rifamycinica]|uniref:helix-turn-helix domain-containing protein n=1 Tax=Micromonospora rifamycinica TaxID=291594 RepID=UPI0033EE33EF
MTGSPGGHATAVSEQAPKHRFGFVDRLLATLVHLRHGLTHDVVAARFGVHRSTISRSIAEIPPLLAERGCRVRDGVRTRTLADVVAHLGYHPQALMDATEVRVHSHFHPA